MLTWCLLSVPHKALLSSCWAPSVGKPLWEPWAAVRQTASRGQLLQRAQCFKALLMFSYLTSRCVAYVSAFLFCFLCYLFFKQLEHSKFIPKKLHFCALYYRALCFCPSLASFHAPFAFLYTSESVLLIRSRAAQAHAVGVPPVPTLPHPVLNLTPLAPLVRFLCSIPQSPWFHQCYVMWGCMTMYWKEWFLCFGKRVWNLLIYFSYANTFATLSKPEPSIIVRPSILLKVDIQ